ncbi:nitroreductase family protein [Mammaliicoccus sciuri]|nr:nitroreductase family protein [Mammaliicoccus sciuri]
MKKIDAIYKRSSVRQFQDIPISDEQLYSILEAGTLAPSSGNMQPWEFIVIKEPPYKEKVVSCTFSGFYAGTSNYQQWIKSAPVILIICANKKEQQQGMVTWGTNGCL